MAADWQVKTLGPNSIRAWRKRRGLTQDELVERVRAAGYSFTLASLSRIERGQQPYSQRSLEAIAAALDCTAADLVTPVAASREKVEILRALDRVDLDEADRLLQIVKLFAK